ncbi:glycoside hydrolase family 76 protein [Xylariaceae sp. AK1471]|nr:glycoside hydrolase family 76 protein [Xylariaceae sp. AK1471]
MLQHSKMAKLSPSLLARLFLSATGALAGLTVDVDNAASVKKAAALVAEDLMSYYKGDIPGILPGPPPEGDYYWWTGGALWNTMLDYRSRTGDSQYDDKISQGILFQKGQNDNFMPANWTAAEANDDQAVWAMAALLAAETGFNEPGSDDPKWLTLAQNVFDVQSSEERRVDEGKCEGGLRWQIYLTNNGYNYVATSSNVAYAALGARLSVLGKNNETQTNLVQSTFNTLMSIGLIDKDFNVFDGVDSSDCANINHLQSSLTAALALEGAAVMYNSTAGEEKWKKMVDGLANRTIEVFFPDGVAKEVACEPSHCNSDMAFFKSFLHRSLASTMKVAPYTAELILPVLKSSAAAAAKSCTGGDNERMCGLNWSGNSDVVPEAGSQMSVLSALLSILPAETGEDAPSNSTNGNGSNNVPTPTDGSPQPSGSTKPGSSGSRAGVSASLVLIVSLLLTSLAIN